MADNKPPPRLFEICGDGSTGPYYLPQRPIFQNCVEVHRADSLLKPEQDYSVDAQRGLIFFKRPLKIGEFATVYYLPLPFETRESYSHNQIQFVGRSPGVGKTSSAELILPPVGEPSPGTSISLGGAKTISVEAGSGRDLSLSQSLDLSIHGNLFPGVRVAAALSDRNTPVSPSGTTKRLQELDKVLFELESQGFKGSLGDFYLSYQEAPLSRYRKKLQGVKGELRFGGISLLGAGASSKGEYFSNYFLGREGFQGPYYLSTPEGIDRIRILPGTEQVYLEGILLLRGSENDYLFDYDNGSVTFTPRIVIDDRSRIEVDFEYSREDFSRSFYSGRGKLQLLDKTLWLGSTFILEKDDKSNPLSGVFTAEDKRIVAAAGAERDSSYKSGAKYVGQGEGDYLQKVDSLGSLYYHYVGEGAGDYSVTFSRVKAGQGTYRYLGGGIYEYVYGGGDYLPIVKLPFPEKHSLLGVDFSYDSGGLFHASGEMALSSQDLNSLSDLDHKREDVGLEINGGLRLGLSRSAAGILDSLNLTNRFRHLGAGFVPFGRVEVLENQRRWDLPEGERSEPEWLQELSLQLVKHSLFRVDGEYGNLQRGDLFDSQRRCLTGELTSPTATAVNFQLEDVSSSQSPHPDSLLRVRDWKRGKIDLSQSISILSPRVGYRGEKRTTKRRADLIEGFSYDEYLTGLKLTPLKNLVFDGQYAERQEKLFLSQWLQDSESKSYRFEVNVREYRNSLSSQLSYTKRKKKYFRGGGSDSDQDLVFAKINYYHPGRGLSCDLFASENQVESSPVVKSYLKVDPGSGDFRFENGEYVPDPYGDYVEITEPVGEGRPSMEVVTGSDLTLEPARLGLPKGSLWSKLKLDLSLEVQNRFLNRRRWSPELLNPWYGSKQDSLQYRRINLRNDLFFYPGSAGQEVRLRHQRTERLTSIAAGTLQEEVEIRHQVRFRQPLSEGYSVELEGAYSTITEELSSSKSLEVDSRLFAGKLIITPRRGLQWTLQHGLQLDREKVEDVRSTLLRSAPNLQWDFSDQGRGDLTLAWSYVKVAPDGSYLNYRMAQGNKPGNNFEVTVNIIYRLGENLEATFNYHLRASPGGETRHFGRFLTRAYF